MTPGPAWLVALLVSLACSASFGSITLDDTARDRVFGGIGGLSGGGATSRLLPSYDQKYRDQILDYLFKPNFGASLHILKVEIGGDAQTTDGTEPSHMHTRTDLNFHRGYEWWLMKEAKKRNPDIKIYGLSWAVPGWIGGGEFFSQDNVDYHVNWLAGAKKVHDIDVDYIGIWNESPFYKNKTYTYVRTLRAAMDNAGFAHVQIVAADGNWEIVDDMLSDKQLFDDVSIVGVHYPGTISPSNAKTMGKPLWASEDYSSYANETGGGCWARILNENWVSGYMTSTISWNLVAAYYPELPFGGDGLMWAQYPWSGHYAVKSPIWVSAHTTQFSRPGWVYLKHEMGSGTLPKGGSYLTLVPPSTSASIGSAHVPHTVRGALAGEDFTLVLETMQHDSSTCIRPTLPPYTVKSQNVTFQLKNFAPGLKLYVWYTKFAGMFSSVFFEQQQPILPSSDGSFSLSLGVDEVWTLSTTTGQQKGSYPTPPPIQPFSVLMKPTYVDDFESYNLNSEASYFSDQTGSWEIYESGDASHGKVMRQMVPLPPIVWRPESAQPISLIGGHAMADYVVACDVYLEKKSGGVVTLGGRVVNGGMTKNNYAEGYFFNMHGDGTWNITEGFGHEIVAQGSASNFKPQQWHRLSLALQANERAGLYVTAEMDGTTLHHSLQDQAKWASGWAAIGSGFHYAQFDNFNLTSLPVN